MAGIARSIAKTVALVADAVLRSVPGPRILVYHQVGVDLGRQMEVTLDDFRSQLDWLEAHADVVDLESAVARREEAGSETLSVLSFDDGYEDLYRMAYPILQARRLPFTLYLATEHTETGDPLGGVAGARPLLWEQVAEMAESGLMTLGGHTHRHRDLRGLDEAEVLAELETSDALIERRLGARPLHFAYPWGYWAPVADRLVRNRYRTAALGAAVRPRLDTDPHLLHRIPVQKSDGPLFFRRKAKGGMRAEELLRRRVKNYRGP